MNEKLVWITFKCHPTALSGRCYSFDSQNTISDYNKLHFYLKQNLPLKFHFQSTQQQSFPKNPSAAIHETDEWHYHMVVLRFRFSIQISVISTLIPGSTSSFNFSWTQKSKNGWYLYVLPSIPTTIFSLRTRFNTQAIAVNWQIINHCHHPFLISLWYQ